MDVIGEREGCERGSAVWGFTATFPLLPWPHSPNSAPMLPFMLKDSPPPNTLRSLNLVS